MSHHSIDRTGFSQLNSTGSSLHYHRCWWAWCRDSFYSRQELLDHINSEHVQKAPPVRFADIPLLQKMEDFYWDSFDMDGLPILPSSSPIQSGDALVEENHREANVVEAIPQSLPSPPASTPNEIPTTPIRMQSTPNSPTNSLLPELNPLPLYMEPNTPHSLSTPLSKRVVHETHASTPSFASLSSSPTRPEYHIPESPSLDALIAEATKTSASTIPDSGHSNEDVFCHTGDSSQEFVLNQLTQGINDDEDIDMHSSDIGVGDKSDLVDNSRNDATVEGHSSILPTNQTRLDPRGASTPLQIQTNQLEPTPRVLSTSPSYLHSPAYPFATTPMRQSWYSAPRRRSSKKIAASEVQSPQSSSRGATPVTSPSVSSFQPAAAQTKPSARPTTSFSSQSALHSDDPSTQSQESLSQTDSTQLSSYPPLQTQAPYFSQTMSQD